VIFLACTHASADFSRMTCIYEPDDLTETRMELLAAVSTDSDLYLAKMPGNCRNISDEVFPGIHVGDKGIQ